MLVRFAGILSGALTPFIATRFHDLVITVAGLLGMVAFVVTASALGRDAGRPLMVLAGATFVLALANYVMWSTGVGLTALPLVQKASFVTFLCWVIGVARRSSAKSEPGSTGAA